MPFHIALQNLPDRDQASEYDVTLVVQFNPFFYILFSDTDSRPFKRKTFCAHVL